MIIRARRQSPAILTDAVARSVLKEAMISVKQASEWEHEREVWVKAQFGDRAIVK